MSEFAPCTTVEEVELLDEDDLVAGYWAGYRGAPEPTASVYSRAYWTGWRNGAADRGLREADQWQAMVAADYARERSLH